MTEISVIHFFKFPFYAANSDESQSANASKPGCTLSALPKIFARLIPMATRSCSSDEIVACFKLVKLAKSLHEEASRGGESLALIMVPRTGLEIGKVVVKLKPHRFMDFFYYYQNVI